MIHALICLIVFPIAYGLVEIFSGCLKDIDSLED